MLFYIIGILFVLCLQKFRGLSFPTISSVGPNAAIIHYSPHAETCAELDPDKIYLFDSGAQVCQLSNLVYFLNMNKKKRFEISITKVPINVLLCILVCWNNLEASVLLLIMLMLYLKYLDGTTDITRTVHFGKPSEHEKASYTAVSVFHCLLWRFYLHLIVDYIRTFIISI